MHASIHEFYPQLLGGSAVDVALIEPLRHSRILRLLHVHGLFGALHPEGVAVLEQM